MMIKLDENIEISPKIVLMNRFVDIVDEEMIVKFLISNILLVEYNSFEKLREIKNNVLGCLVNLDDYLFCIDFQNNDIDNKVSKMINNIKSIKNFYITAFTVHNFRKIKEIFIKQGIKYYVRHENSKDELINIIKETITRVDHTESFRSSLRIGFTDKRYETKIKHREMIVEGIIKDLSINGLGIEINNFDDYKNLHIGSFVAINLDFGVLSLNIQRGIIVRKDNDNRIIGIKMDITDKYEIDDENKIILENIIKTWITKAVRSNNLNIGSKELFLRTE